jgi:hypothetical protein
MTTEIYLSKRLERRGVAAKNVVLSLAFEDMNAAILEDQPILKKGRPRQKGRLANKNLSWYKISCLPTTALIAAINPGPGLGFFLICPEVSHV